MVRNGWLLGLALLGMPLATHAAPSLPPISDARLAQFQTGMENGCMNAGRSRDRPDAEVHAFCSCMTRVLRAKVSRADWQKAYEADAAHDQAGASQFMATYVPSLQVCKDEERKAAGK